MNLRDRRGFTLLEVMVAIAVVALISGPLLQTFVTSAKVGQRSYDIDKANAATVRVIEDLKGYSLTALTGAGSGFDHDEAANRYSRTEYYGADWSGPYGDDGDGSRPFRADISLSSSTSMEVEQSYIARLGDGAGYYLEAAYEQMTDRGSYTIRVEEESGGFVISSNYAVLRTSKGGAGLNLRINVPQGDVDGVIPIVVDVSGPDGKKVTLSVNNQTGKEVILYIYGDLNEEHVTAELSDNTMGNMSVSRMSVSSETLEFNKLALSVQVVRTADSQKLTDYTTMLYFAG